MTRCIFIGGLYDGVTRHVNGDIVTVRLRGLAQEVLTYHRVDNRTFEFQEDE